MAAESVGMSQKKKDRRKTGLRDRKNTCQALSAGLQGRVDEPSGKGARGRRMGECGSGSAGKDNERDYPRECIYIF